MVEDRSEGAARDGSGGVTPALDNLPSMRLPLPVCKSLGTSSGDQLRGSVPGLRFHAIFDHYKSVIISSPSKSAPSDQLGQNDF